MPALGRELHGHLYPWAGHRRGVQLPRRRL
jgi:fido (protein-threonine AMPylation protein)